jgi:hydrogenase maturation protease
MRYLIGIGNYGAFDDSIGLRVAEAISERGLDRDFAAIELGGNLLDLLHYLGEETERVLIVDTARMGVAPGEFAFFEPEQVESRRDLAGFSTHEGDVMKVLALGASLGQPLAPITIMGIEPARIAEEIGLSAPLAARLEEYVAAAVAFFGRSAS